jgi:acetylornithine deacetylase/succinyl-diaminopimelate desuccinylase-like protein
VPYSIPASHPALQAAAQVLAEVYGEQPYLVRMGGTLPVSEVFQRVLGIYTVFFSFSTADEDFHAPNEFMRLNRFYEGLDAWTRLLDKMGALPAL